MTEQLQLVDVPTTGRSTRTEFVMNAIRTAGDSGLHPDEIGAILHAYDGKHAAAERCEWCGQDGIRLLRRLNRQRLVTRKHGGAAVAVDNTPAAEKRPSGMSGDIGF